MTQAVLARQLNVSIKTISKWETGQGFPEVTQFPPLSRVFGVSIDYLMTGERRGIMFAGNILVDVVKNIWKYPQKGTLASITDVSRSVGGLVPNTAINLAKIDRSIPLCAIGRVGDDEYGRYVTGRMEHFGIDTKYVKVSPTAPTSFSDVMSEPQGERTFFHARGANAEFNPNDVNLNTLPGKILHIGYILLLDCFDRADAEYGTVMARFLHEAQERGIKTSIDVVSDSGADYHSKIAPALPYCDYVVINEIECCSVWGLEARRRDGRLHWENIRLAMRKTADCGVRERVVVHSKEAGFCLDTQSGQFTQVPSLQLPKEMIKGSVGAGDAFCAGCLYAIETGLTAQAMLEFASAAAACSLLAENSVDGMVEKSEVWKTANRYPRRNDFER